MNLARLLAALVVAASPFLFAPAHAGSDPVARNLAAAALRQFKWNGSLKIVTVGDSKTADGGNPIIMSAARYQRWLMGLSGQRFNYSVANNVGIGGTKTTDWVSLYPGTAIAKKPGIVIIELGTNDFGGAAPTPEATVAANMLSFIQQNEAIGAYTILSKITVRSYWPGLTAPQIIAARNMINWFNHYIDSTLAQLPGVFVANPNKYWVDRASPTGDPKAGYTFEGLHDDPIGAYYRALSYLEVLSTIVPPVYSHWFNPSDLYDATNNPQGNLLANGDFSGTGGTVGTGVSGTVADTWTVSRLLGSTTGTVTAQPRTDGFNGTEQVLSFAGASGTTQEAYNFIATSITGFAVGDVVYGECEIDMSGSNHVTELALIAEAMNAGGAMLANVVDGNQVGATDYYPAVAYNVKLKTPPLTLPASTSVLRLRVLDFFNASVGAETHTLKVRDCSLRKV